MPVTKDEFDAWKNHHVTQAVFAGFTRIISQDKLTTMMSMWANTDPNHHVAVLLPQKEQVATREHFITTLKDLTHEDHDSHFRDPEPSTDEQEHEHDGY